MNPFTMSLAGWAAMPVRSAVNPILIGGRGCAAPPARRPVMTRTCTRTTTPNTFFMAGPSQKLGLVENGVSCSSCVQQDRSCVCR